MAEVSQENEILEKTLVKAILKTGRILVYRQELEQTPEGENEDTYIFQYNNDYSDFDVLTDPELLQLNEVELSIFREIFDIMDDIDRFSEILTKYLIRKMQTCTMTGHPYAILLEKAKKYFKVEEDYSEYNEHNYTGKVKYTIKDGDVTLGTIVKNIEYCNHCIDDPRISIGIQKCIEYIIEKGDKK